MLAGLLVSVGACLGALCRAKTLEYLEQIVSRKYLGIFLVNTFASFFLGIIFASFISLDKTDSSFLFFSVGFLGSFSTFSSFIGELFQIISKKRWREGLLLSFASISLGILALFLGIYCANG